MLGVVVLGNRDSGDGAGIVVVGVDGRAMVVVALALALSGFIWSCCLSLPWPSHFALPCVTWCGLVWTFMV